MIAVPEKTVVMDKVEGGANTFNLFIEYEVSKRVSTTKMK
jgi:hypothetical protein